MLKLSFCLKKRRKERRNAWIFGKAGDGRKIRESPLKNGRVDTYGLKKATGVNKEAAACWQKTIYLKVLLQKVFDIMTRSNPQAWYWRRMEFLTLWKIPGLEICSAIYRRCEAYWTTFAGNFEQLLYSNLLNKLVSDIWSVNLSGK